MQEDNKKRLRNLGRNLRGTKEKQKKVNMNKTQCFKNNDIKLDDGYDT